MGSTRTWREGTGPIHQAVFVIALLVFAASLVAGAVGSFRMWGLPPIRLDATALARALYARGDYEGAAREYERAGLIDPTHDISQMRVDVYRRMGDTDALARMYRERVRKRPWDAKAHAVLGRFLLEQREYGEGLRSLERAHELAPGLPGIHEALGRGYLYVGRNREAEQIFREGLKLDPFSAGLHDGLGVALGDLGRRDEAAREFQRALRIEPKNSFARSHLDLLQSGGPLQP